MTADDLLFEACHTVRLRYSPAEFGNLYLHQIIAEVCEEARRRRTSHVGGVVAVAEGGEQTEAIVQPAMT